MVSSLVCFLGILTNRAEEHIKIWLECTERMVILINQSL